MKNQIRVTGNSNELFFIDEKNNYKSIRLMVSDGEEEVMLELTSVDSKNNHTILSKFLNKDIEMSISITE